MSNAIQHGEKMASNGNFLPVLNENKLYFKPVICPRRSDGKEVHASSTEIALPSIAPTVNYEEQPGAHHPSPLLKWQNLRCAPKETTYNAQQHKVTEWLERNRIRVVRKLPRLDPLILTSRGTNMSKYINFIFPPPFAFRFFSESKKPRRHVADSLSGDDQARIQDQQSVRKFCPRYLRTLNSEKSLVPLNPVVRVGGGYKQISWKVGDVLPCLGVSGRELLTILKCSVCHGNLAQPEQVIESNGRTKTMFSIPRYCPHCGAKNLVSAGSGGLRANEKSDSEYESERVYEKGQQVRQKKEQVFASAHSEPIRRDKVKEAKKTWSKRGRESYDSIEDWRNVNSFRHYVSEEDLCGARDNQRQDKELGDTAGKDDRVFLTQGSAPSTPQPAGTANDEGDRKDPVSGIQASVQELSAGLRDVAVYMSHGQLVSRDLDNRGDSARSGSSQREGMNQSERGGRRLNSDNSFSGSSRSLKEDKEQDKSRVTSTLSRGGKARGRHLSKEIGNSHIQAYISIENLDEALLDQNERALSQVARAYSDGYLADSENEEQTAQLAQGSKLADDSLQALQKQLSDVKAHTNLHRRVHARSDVKSTENKRNSKTSSRRSGRERKIRSAEMKTHKSNSRTGSHHNRAVSAGILTNYRSLYDFGSSWESSDTLHVAAYSYSDTSDYVTSGGNTPEKYFKSKAYSPHHLLKKRNSSPRKGSSKGGGRASSTHKEPVADQESLGEKDPDDQITRDKKRKKRTAHKKSSWRSNRNAVVGEDPIRPHSNVRRRRQKHRDVEDLSESDYQFFTDQFQTERTGPRLQRSLHQLFECVGINCYRCAKHIPGCEGVCSMCGTYCQRSGGACEICRDTCERCNLPRWKCRSAVDAANTIGISEDYGDSTHDENSANSEHEEAATTSEKKTPVDSFNKQPKESNVEVAVTQKMKRKRKVVVKKAKDPRGVRRVARSRRPSTNDETQEPENDIEVTNHEEEQDWLEEEDPERENTGDTQKETSRTSTSRESTDSRSGNSITKSKSADQVESQMVVYVRNPEWGEEELESSKESWEDNGWTTGDTWNRSTEEEYLYESLESGHQSQEEHGNEDEGSANKEDEEIIEETKETEEIKEKEDAKETEKTEIVEKKVLPVADTETAKNPVVQNTARKLRGIQRVNAAFRERADLAKRLKEMMKGAAEGVTGEADIRTRRDSTIDYLAQYRLVDKSKLELYGRPFALENEDEDGIITYEQMLVALEGIPTLNGMSRKQLTYVLQVLELGPWSRVTFKMFSVLTALCERVMQLDHFVKEMVEGLDLSEVEWKMDLYKDIFYFTGDHSVNFITADDLRIELKAGGLSQQQEDHVIKHILSGRENGQISFLDYMAYIPLFITIHRNICDNALDMSRDKFTRKRLLTRS